MKTKHVTHFDLDGVGCSLVIDEMMNVLTPNKEVHLYDLNYGNLEQLVMNNVNSSDEDIFLIISDLHFSTAFLSNLCTVPHIKKLLYIDHHDRSDERQSLESIKLLNKGKFNYRWRKGHSATAICFQLLKEINENGEYEQLNEIVNRIDAYDEWKTDSEYFQEGFKLNDLFWELTFSKFRDKFKGGILYDEDSLKIIKEREEERQIFFKENKDYFVEETFHKNKKIFVTFQPTGMFRNDYTLFFKADLYLIFIKRKKADKTVFSLRSRGSLNLNVFLNKFCEGKLGYTGGGHHGAAGLAFPSSVELEDFFEEFMEFLENYK